MAESREQIAQREVGHTDISPWLSRALTAVFLATISSVPALQTVSDIRQNRGGDRNGAIPQSIDALRLPLRGCCGHCRQRRAIPSPGCLQPTARFSAPSTPTKTPSKSGPWSAQWIRPRLQEPLTRFLGVGNEQVYCGRSQMALLSAGGGPPHRTRIPRRTPTGAPRGLGQRVAGGTAAGSPARHPRVPRSTRRTWNRAPGRARAGEGIDPSRTPVASLYTDAGAAVHNPSSEDFLARLRRPKGSGSSTPRRSSSRRLRSNGEPQFLATDTHWTPQAVDLVAKELAKRFADGHAFESRTEFDYTSREARRQQHR